MGAIAPVGRGRPRAVGVEQRLVEATLELAGELGVAGMSMDDLAQRAGVSKATIYRRWPSKEALVLDAMRHGMLAPPDVDTGSLRGDLVDYLTGFAERMSSTTRRDVLPHLIEASLYDVALRASLEEYVQHRRGPMIAIVRRGVERGELAADTDVEVLVDVLISPFMYRRLLSHAPIDTTLVDRVLALVLPDL